jgi:hypothetical protein
MDGLRECAQHYGAASGNVPPPPPPRPTVNTVTDDAGGNPAEDSAGEEKWELAEAGTQAEAGVSVETISNSVTGQFIVFAVTYTNRSNGEQSTTKKTWKDFSALNR